MDLRELAYLSWPARSWLDPIVLSGEIALLIDPKPNPRTSFTVGMQLQVPLVSGQQADLHCVIPSRILWDAYTGSR